MFNILIFLVIINQISGLSYNRPKFCPNATWNLTAITFLDKPAVLGERPIALFVNSNNTVYVFSSPLMRVQGLFEGGMNSTSASLPDIRHPSKSIFVTTNGDIYIDAKENGQVEKVSLNTEQRIPVISFDGYCADLFIDIEDNLYCSVAEGHQIVKTSLNNNTNTITPVAGNGHMGNESNQLNTPNGIVVNMNFDLYVADTRNHRIQLFRFGQMNGVTIVMKGLSEPLKGPYGIALDADDYLFIVDKENSRIVGEGPDGFRCLVGCRRIAGSSPSTLRKPSLLSFDSFGNIFVTDTNNDRIQKFLLQNNFCDQTATHQMKIVKDQTTANQMTISTDQITTDQMTLSTDQTTTSPMKASTNGYSSNSKHFILTILPLVHFYF